MSVESINSLEVIGAIGNINGRIVNVDFTYTRYSSKVVFRALTSLDVVSYCWDFGDGNSTCTSNSTVTHTYASPGCYAVNLTVVDREGKASCSSDCIAVGCGDVNCDGVVNAGDVIALTYHIGYGDPICSEWAADVNGDGSIDVADLLALFYYFGYGEDLNCKCECKL